MYNDFQTLFNSLLPLKKLPLLSQGSSTPRSLAPGNHLLSATSISFIVELEVAGFYWAAPANKIIL